MECINLETRGLRAFTIFFTAVFAVLGVAVVTIGILCCSLWSDYFQVVQNAFGSIPYILIGIGFVLMGITVLGFLGAIFKNWILIVAYAGLLGLIIIVEVGGAITCGVIKSQASSTVQIGLKYVMANNSTTMANIQNKFSCCGINGPADYNGSIPNSCCPTSTTCTIANAVPMGCLPVFVSWSISDLGIAVGVIIGAIALQGISIIVVARLYSLLKKEHNPPKE